MGEEGGGVEGRNKGLQGDTPHGKPNAVQCAPNTMGSTTPDNGKDTATIIGIQMTHHLTRCRYVATPHRYLHPHPHLNCAQNFQATIIPYPTHPELHTDALVASQFTLVYRSLLRGGRFQTPEFSLGGKYMEEHHPRQCNTSTPRCHIRRT
jgi:hypothetical protein